MTKFRPCIDLYEGKVRQIVGSTLSLEDFATFSTDVLYTAPEEKDAAYFANMYKNDNLSGGHIIMLGPGNEEEAKKALQAYLYGLQIGGGINIDNAEEYLKAGASKVIISSWLFVNNSLNEKRLIEICKQIGNEKLVFDLSCRQKDDTWFVAINKWQTLTDLEINKENLDKLSQYCSEFLIHAVDVEGKRKGIDEELVEKLGQWVDIPTTYAGGANSIEDLQRVKKLSKGTLDLTIGSALDIFGGNVEYEECVKFNNRQMKK